MSTRAQNVSRFESHIGVWRTVAARCLTLSYTTALMVTCATCDRPLTLPSVMRSPHDSRMTARNGQPSGTTTNVDGRQTPPIAVVHLAFDVLRVDWPAEGPRDSQKVWNHVDTLRLDADTIALLARNGLRVGAVPKDAWAAIETILDSPRTQLRRETLFASQSQPLALQMSRIIESESIFVYGKDGRASGKTFRAGDKLITVDYLVRSAAAGELNVRVGFEIRDDLGVMTWRRENGVIREVPAFDRHVFGDLVASLALSPSETLAIGMSEKADNEYLIGSRFLTVGRDGRKFETLLLITPKSFRSGVRLQSGGS